jgi:hypothetical protein
MKALPPLLGLVDSATVPLPLSVVLPLMLRNPLLPAPPFSRIAPLLVTVGPLMVRVSPPVLNRKGVKTLKFWTRIDAARKNEAQA